MLSSRTTDSEENKPLVVTECETLMLPSYDNQSSNHGEEDVSRLMLSAQRSAMLNAVRFGMVAGRERLIVAGQDGFIRIFELPPHNIPVSRTNRSGQLIIFREVTQ